ncbi:MAG: hypothetical protein HFH82_03485 [Lachnospiraceae bacterium]|nr:hypothetical protein [Lachnospiraceae bacterium]
MFESGTFEYGLKTGDLPEKVIVKIFEKALSKVAEEINDSRIPKKRKMRKSTGPFGRSTPDAEEPEYDHIYIYSHRPSNLFLQLYPNQEKNGRIKFPEEGIVWNLYVTILSDYPARMSEQDHIQEFGGRVMEELFQKLPGEKVLIKKYAPGENRL